MLEISVFRKLIDAQPNWLMDGAIGTELERRGLHTELPFWTAFAVDQAPEILTEIYLEYLKAGCQILTANTFRISSYLFEKHARSGEFFPLLERTCRLSRELIPVNTGILLAASIATLEDCYRPDLVPEESILRKYHRAQLKALMRCPFDFILAETINSIREAKIIMQLCHEMELPLLLSLITNGQGQFLSGEEISEVAQPASRWTPAGILLNCRPVGDIKTDFAILSLHYDGPKGIYPNAPGEPHPTRGWEPSTDACKILEDFTEELLDKQFKFIGGCCGTTPDMLHTIGRKIQRHT